MIRDIFSAFQNSCRVLGSCLYPKILKFVYYYSKFLSLGIETAKQGEKVTEWFFMVRLLFTSPWCLFWTNINYYNHSRDCVKSLQSTRKKVYKHDKAMSLSVYHLFYFFFSLSSVTVVIKKQLMSCFVWTPVVLTAYLCI